MTSAVRALTMDDLTIEPAAVDGPPSAPASFGVPCEADVTGAEVLPGMRPGSIGVRYRLARRFRTYDAIACVPVFLAQTRSSDTVRGERGERIHAERTYRPVTVGGLPVEATRENLDAIIRAAVPETVVRAHHPAFAERELHDAMLPALDRYLLIDDQVWITV